MELSLYSLLFPSKCKILKWFVSNVKSYKETHFHFKVTIKRKILGGKKENVETVYDCPMSFLYINHDYAEKKKRKSQTRTIWNTGQQNFL